jgi:diguanylate cyclase (GGDEF)-like protein
MRSIAALATALDGATDAASAARVVVDHLATEEGLRARVRLEGGAKDAGGAGGGAEAGEAGGAVVRAPVVVRGRAIGALEAEPAADQQTVHACAVALGRRIEGLAKTSDAAKCLVRHLVAMAALEHPADITRRLLRAAVDVVLVDSAALVRTPPAGDARPAATGPLGPALIAGEHQPLAAIALVARGETLGVLLVASSTDATAETELLEQLAAHAAACLRTAETLGALRERAATDPLTGLGHHATFHEALAASHRRPTTAVVVCDIDGFKHLNDAHGHAHGDRVLRGVAEAMCGALRRGDQLFRIGGDEFAALLAVDSETEAFEAAARLRAAVKEARLGVTVSIGVAVPHEDELDAAVLARADRALYAVKAGGRDGVALANDEPLPAAPALG